MGILGGAGVAYLAGVNAGDVELKRIRWRCRRGMRELDQLFERYLNREWPASSDTERGIFLQLLDCEDDKLWRWFMDYEQCPDVALASLIQRIRQLPA